MKKVLLIVMAMAMGFWGYTQKNAGVPAEMQKLSRKALNTAPLDGSETLMNGQVAPYKAATVFDESEIGQTFYDLQSNKTVSNRIYYFDDGTIGTVWTYGMEATTYNDRGAGYNYFDGTAWGPWPTARVEGEKCGWPAYGPLGEDGEIIVSHNAIDNALINKRDVKGTGTWQESYFAPPAGIAKITWPKIAISGVNHDVMHLFIQLREEFGGQGTPYTYSRTADGGVTWEVNHQIIDLIGPSYYLEHAADEMAIAEPRAGVVAFVLVNAWHDLVLMKSSDEGDTWVKTIIWEHPYPFFDWNTTITTDTIWCPDHSGAIALDSDGMAHIVFGLGRVAHTEVGTTYSYWPYTDGIVYWNETMPAFEAANQHRALAYENLVEDVNYIGWTQDVNNNGIIDFLPDLLTYRTLGICTMPVIGIDDLNRVFVAYASTTETYDNGTYNYKHIWVRTSPDNGTTWGDFIDLNTDLIHIFDECIYPLMAPNSDDYVHMFYNIDATPGLGLDDDHPHQQNKEVYVKLKKDDIVGIGEPTPVQTQVFVSQNYPNPFRSISYVQVETGARTPLSLEVYNLMGQMVYRTDAGMVSAGTHRLTIQADKLQPGVYFYTVSTVDYEVTRKMMVE
ncbi:MAG: T9SS type A sorting domain-containing protein [Bacteroidales bacterium]|nr:T9SS type A sorting domain-containing protein [Bacteroidales bacterium]